MMSWLLSFLSGPLLQSIVNAYKAKLEAAGKQDVLATELAVKEIEAEISARQAAKEVIIAEQGRWWTALPRPAFALAFVIYVWKVIVWDKVLGWGTTDPLSGVMNEWAWIVLTAYFGGRTLEKVAQVFRGRR